MNAEDYVLLVDRLNTCSVNTVDWDSHTVFDHGYPIEDRVFQINLDLFIGRNAAFWKPDQKSEAGMGWGWCPQLAWSRANEIKRNDVSLWAAFVSSWRIPPSATFTFPTIITTVKPPPRVSYPIGQPSGLHPLFQRFYTRRLGT